MTRVSPLADVTEKEWAKQIADLARMLGWLRYHTWRSERSPAGFPDEVLVRDRVVFMELKRDLTGKASADRARQPSPLQVEWLDRLAKAGGETYLARPSDLEEIARVLGGRWIREPDYLRDSAGRYWTPASLWIPGRGRHDSCGEKAA